MYENTISIIIPCYNYATYVSKAIESVLNQSLENVQIIVVDDCSTDNSLEVISKYSSNIEIIAKKENGGHGAGFNSGFELATGRQIMFLDADDFLLEGALEKIVANYKPNTAIYNYRMRLANEDGELGPLYPPKEQNFKCDNASEQVRLTGRYPGTVTSGLVFNKDVLVSIMPMPAEDFRQGGDGYLCAVAPLYGNVVFHDDVISAYRQHKKNHSKFMRQIGEKALWNIEHNNKRYDAIIKHCTLLDLEYERDMSSKDLLSIENKIADLLFNNKTKNINGETRQKIAMDALKLKGNNKSISFYFNMCWWLSIGYLPRFLAYKFLLWKIDANSRPSIISKIAKFLRKNAKIMVQS